MIDSTLKTFSVYWGWETLPYVKDWETLWKVQGPMQPVLILERVSTQGDTDELSLR